MSWFYAGPEAKPVGPVSLEELHARRLSGALSPDTYVIEHTGQPDESRAWKRYGEVFPARATLPPLPPVPVPGAAAAPPPFPPRIEPHPLFPSAAPVPAPAPPVFVSPAPGVPAANPHLRLASSRTNPTCIWAFSLGLASLLLIPACGLGTLLAFPALFVAIVGLVQVQKHRGQPGQGMAIAGLCLAVLSLVLSLVILVVALPSLTFHEQTTTEQTSNDSE